MGQRVFVYRNLHRACWSIKAVDGTNAGRVVGHADELSVFGPCFKVGEAGRQRVIAEGRKNVHAGVVGTLANEEGHQHVRVTYNPYAAPTFTDAESGSPVTEALFARLNSLGKVWAAGVLN